MAAATKRSWEAVGTFIGQVLKRNENWKAANVRVQVMKLDTRYTMYYHERQDYWVADPDGQTSIGDLVLIKPLAEPQSEHIAHYMKKIVFKAGNIIDPVSGKKCRGTEFVEYGLQQPPKPRKRYYFGRPVKQEVLPSELKYE